MQTMTSSVPGRCGSPRCSTPGVEAELVDLGPVLARVGVHEPRGHPRVGLERLSRARRDRAHARRLVLGQQRAERQRERPRDAPQRLDGRVARARLDPRQDRLAQAGRAGEVAERHPCARRCARITRPIRSARTSSSTVDDRKRKLPVATSPAGAPGTPRGCASSSAGPRLCRLPRRLRRRRRGARPRRLRERRRRGVLRGLGGGSEDWAAQVNAICERNEKETQKIAAKAQDELEANDARLSAEIIERTVPLQKDLLAELGDVEPPEDIAEDYDAFLARIDDGVDLLPRLAESLRSGKEDPELAAKFEEIAQDTRPFAAEHGLDACVPDAG